MQLNKNRNAVPQAVQTVPAGSLEDYPATFVTAVAPET